MWKKIKLGNVCKIVNGGTPDSKIKEYWGGEIKWLTPKDMGKLKNKYVDATERQITVEGLDNSSAQLVPANSLILSCRAPIGYVFINSVEMSFNQGCKGLLPSNELNIEYLYYFIISSKKLLNDLGTGTTFKEISSKKLGDIEIFLPPLEEQQRIVAKLDVAFAEIDKMILLKKKSILNLDKFFSNQLNSLFLDNSNNWESTTLGAYYDVRDGTHDSPKYVSQGIPLVTSKNLKNGMIDLTKIKYIKNEDYLLIKKRSGVSIGDVLMAMIGTIGNPVIIKNDKEFAIKNVALFKVKKNQSSDFLKYYLDSTFVKNKMLKDSKGTTQQFVGLGYLRNFPIKVPSFEQQQAISLKIMSLEKNVDDLKNKYNLILKNYISLKNSLLTELLNKKSKAA